MNLSEGGYKTLNEQKQQKSEDKNEKIILRLPLIHTELRLKTKYYKILKSFSPLILLGLLILVGTFLVLIVPVDGPFNQDLLITPQYCLQFF